MTEAVALGRDMLSEHLYRLFREASEANRARRDAIRTPEDWSRERERLLAAYRQMLGPFPERNDLRPKVTGTLERERYVIEKVVYETQPGLLVTANAYVPKGGHGRAPAVLVPCGHSENGKAAETYQRVCAGLANKGYFVLIYDPIGQGERAMYWDAATGRSALGGNTTQHSYVGNQYVLAGLNLAQLMVWDSIRSIDYLCSRPEVDPQRIAMAGNSGGGTNTAYTVPLDDRIKAAAVCCYVTTLAWRRRVWSTGDAEQNLVGQLPAGLDHADMLRLMAPRPVLVGSARLDYFPLEGARESAETARTLYETLGVSDRITHAIADAGHGYTIALRRATYGWLNRWLDVDADDTELDTPVERDQDLQVTPRGQVALLGSEDAFRLLRRRVEADAERPVEAASAAVQTARRLTGFASPQERAAARPAGTHLARYNGLTRVESFAVWPEPDVVVPGEALTWRAHEGPKRVLLWIAGNDDEASRAAHRAMSTALLPEGWLVATVDVRGVGETAPRESGRLNAKIMGGEAFLTYETFVAGQPLLGMRVRDAACALDYLVSREDVSTTDGAAVAGWGSAGLIALHLAAFDECIRAVATVGTLATYRSIVLHERYDHSVAGFIPGAAGPGGYDLGDLVAAVAPRRVLQLGRVDHCGARVQPETGAERPAAAMLVEWLRESLTGEG